MIFYILFFILIGLSYYYLFKRNANYWTSRDVIQETRGTSLGTLWDFIVGDRSLAEICKGIYDKYQNEPFVGLLWGSKTALLIREPELIQHVLASDFQNFNSRGFVTNPQTDLLSDNVLLLEDVQKWKLIRQKVSPVFTSSRLKNMFYILQHCGRDFVRFVNDNLKEDPFSLLYTYTTASIGSAVFGIDTKAHNQMNSPFLEMSINSVAPSSINNMRFFIGNLSATLFKFLRIKLFGDHEDFFIGVVKNVLREREAESQKRHDFIDLCIELQKNGVMRDPGTGFEVEPTDELLAAQAYFFFLAGADTSANTMNFVLIELAHNPNILAQLQKEIDATYNKCKDPSYDDIDKLEYLDMVLNETMRKYPPVGIIQRRCTNTTILPIGNLKVEKDVMVIIPVFAIHRDEKYYDNPEVYDPERFRGKSASSNAKYTYLPFGEGNRVCLGARFARLQVKVGIASLLRHFTLKPEAPTPNIFERSFFSIRSSEKNYYSIHTRPIAA